MRIVLVLSLPWDNLLSVYVLYLGFFNAAQMQFSLSACLYWPTLFAVYQSS